jgi:hypothetical protein
VAQLRKNLRNLTARKALLIVVSMLALKAGS